MRKLYKLALIFMFMTWVGAYVGVCDEMYVLPRKSITYEEPDVQSLKLHILTQNMLVNTFNVSEDGWTRTNFGWIRSMYLGFEPFKESRHTTNIASIEVRKRASNFTSSAAAGRGLSAENVRDRDRVSFRDYDFDTIKWLEANFDFDYPYLVEFWAKQRGGATAVSQSKESDKEGPCRAMCLPIEENE